MIFILTGPIHSGKTSLLKKIADTLKTNEYRVDGFLSESIWKRNEIIGYDLFDLKGEKSYPFIRREGNERWQRIGSFFFIPRGLAKAHKIILCSHDGDFLIIDEVGPLELKGEGLWPALKDIISNPMRKCLIVVRKSILKKFLDMLGKSEVKVFDIQERELYTRIMEAII